MKHTLHLLTCFIILTFVGLTSFTKGEYPIKQQKITLHFQHTIGGQLLILSSPLKNILGENIVIEKFKYYISHFAVEDHKGKIIKLPVQYYLIDEGDSLSKTISFSLPISSIRNLSFLLGVDSAKNVSGAQTGALDPIHGMFWTWNSGYIMAKLEGTSPVSNAPGHRFIYHIGGYKKDQQVSRIIVLPISKEKKQFSQIDISVDINQWFKSQSTISIAETPVCEVPGILSKKMADNYQNMFAIKAIY